MTEAEFIVQAINVGDGDGAGMMIFTYNGQRISVSIFPRSTASKDTETDIEGHLIDLLERCVAASGEGKHEEWEQLEDEAVLAILDVGEATFDEVAPDCPYKIVLGDLHSFLYPKPLHFASKSSRAKPPW